MYDILHNLLSLGAHRGIDVEQALAGAMARNAKRAEEGV